MQSYQPTVADFSFITCFNSVFSCLATEETHKPRAARTCTDKLVSPVEHLADTSFKS